MSRVLAYLENKKAQPPPILLEGQDAANRIIRSGHESPSIIGFNSIEAERLRLKQGDEVQVAPEDTGKFFYWKFVVISAEHEKICTGRSFPTLGRLIALNREEVVLQVQGQEGIVHVHFPRLGFTIQRTVKEKLWLTCCNMYSKKFENKFDSAPHERMLDIGLQKPMFCNTSKMRDLIYLFRILSTISDQTLWIPKKPR